MERLVCTFGCKLFSSACDGRHLESRHTYYICSDRTSTDSIRLFAVFGVFVPRVLPSYFWSRKSRPRSAALLVLLVVYIVCISATYDLQYGASDARPLFGIFGMFA